METFWVLEYDSLKQQIEGKSRFPPDVYKADGATMEAYLEVQKIHRPSYRMREATVDDWAAIERAGYEIKYVHLDPDCRNWFFSVGVGGNIRYLPTDFDTRPWTEIHRNTSLSEMLEIARQRQESDPLSHVSFRPAIPEEIAEDSGRYENKM